jgi:hypothetical protein
VTKDVLAGEMWPTIAGDWTRMKKALEAKYGKVNTEYQELLS